MKLAALIFLATSISFVPVLADADMTVTSKDGSGIRVEHGRSGGTIEHRNGGFQKDTFRPKEQRQAKGDLSKRVRHGKSGGSINHLNGRYEKGSFRPKAASGVAKAASRTGMMGLVFTAGYGWGKIIKRIID